jgi:serine/threonine protein kinase
MQKIICPHENYTNEFKHVLHNIEDYIKQGEILKNDIATTIIKSQNIIIKRFNHKNFWSCLKRTLQKSRAARCWENAHRLLSLNIKTPKALATIEKKFGWLRGTTYYLMEYIQGIPLDTYFALPHDKEEELYYAKKIVEIFTHLKKQHVRHRDVKADNFFIVGKNIFLLDLDYMKKTSALKYFLTQAQQKDKKRFLRNWDENSRIQKLFLNLFVKKENLCQKIK